MRSLHRLFGLAVLFLVPASPSGVRAFEPSVPDPVRGPTVPARRILLPPVDQGSGGDISKFTVRIPGWNDGRKLDEVIRDFALANLPDYSAAVLGGVTVDDGVDQTAHIQLAASKVPASGGRLRFPCGKILYSALRIPNPRLLLASAHERCAELTTLPGASQGTTLQFTGDYSGADGLAFAHGDFEGGVARTSGYTVDLANGYGSVRNSTFRHCWVCVRMGAKGGRQDVSNNTFQYAADGAARPGSGYILVENTSVGPLNIISGNLGLSNFLDPTAANRRYPDFAVKLVNTGETFIWGNDWISNRTTYLVQPGDGQTVQATRILTTSNDSAQRNSVVIQPMGTGYVFDFAIPTPWITNTGNHLEAGVGVLLDATRATPSTAIPYPINLVAITGGGQITSTTGQLGSGLKCMGPVNNVTVTGVTIAGWEVGVDLQDGCRKPTLADNKIGDYGVFDVPIANRTNKVGIRASSGVVGLNAHDNDLEGNSVAPIRNASSHPSNRIHDNPGYNPVGSSNVTVAPSPFAMGPLPTATSFDILGGAGVVVKTGSADQSGLLTRCNATPCNLVMPPGTTVTVTYTAAPTITQTVH